MSQPEDVTTAIDALRSKIDAGVGAGKINPYLLMFVYEALLGEQSDLMGYVPTVLPSDIADDFLLRPLDDLDLGARPRNRLAKVEATNLGRIVQLSRQQVMNIRQINETYTSEIEAMVRRLGLELDTVLPQFIVEIVGRPNTDGL